VVPLPPGWDTPWDGRTALHLPGGGELWLDPAVGFDAPARVRARAGGERIALPGRSHSHALKHVLQDLAMPPWVRAAMPLLVAADGTVMAAGDQVRSAAFDAWLRAHGAQLAWAR
jgi:tRNA(Ile)-lysidine synthase